MNYDLPEMVKKMKFDFRGKNVLTEQLLEFLKFKNMQDEKSTKIMVSVI